MVNKENIKQAISIQLTFNLSIELPNGLFSDTMFLANDASILTPCLDGTKHMYSPSQGFKKKAFALNCQNIIQTIGIQLSFTFYTKLQKRLFLAKQDQFFT